MDEMWSFYGDKQHQIWLWWAMDHETGEVVAYWFGTREHHNLDKLLALLAPLKIGKVYTDGNYAYVERLSSKVLVVSKKNTQKIERNDKCFDSNQLTSRLFCSSNHYLIWFCLHARNQDKHGEYSRFALNTHATVPSVQFLASPLEHTRNSFGMFAFEIPV